MEKEMLLMSNFFVKRRSCKWRGTTGGEMGRPYHFMWEREREREKIPHL